MNKNIIIAILGVALALSIAYGQIQKSEAELNKASAMEARQKAEENAVVARELEHRAQRMAEDARRAQLIAIQEKENAEIKVSQLERKLKNCR